jgi:hypothetical protein
MLVLGTKLDIDHAQLAHLLDSLAHNTIRPVLVCQLCKRGMTQKACRMTYIYRQRVKCEK